jgi:hypothetical protein
VTGQATAEVYEAIVAAIGRLGIASACLDDTASAPLAEAVIALEAARTNLTAAWDALAWARERIEAGA